MTSAVPRPSIRRAQVSDLPALVALENDVFPGDRLSRRSLRRYVDATTTRMLVASGPADALAGYALVAFRRGSRVARLYSIAVAPAAAGRGTGRALLAASEAEARTREAHTLRLEVRADNGRALALYERAGYRRFATIEDYYEDGATAIRLEKPLDPTAP